MWVKALGAHRRKTPYGTEMLRLNPPVDWRLQGWRPGSPCRPGTDQVTTGVETRHPLRRRSAGGEEMSTPQHRSHRPLQLPQTPAHHPDRTDRRSQQPGQSAARRPLRRLHRDLAAGGPQPQEHRAPDRARSRGFGDAYNVTDNQSAMVHCSSLAVSIMLKQAGMEPVVQFTCRDRNRLGMQGDLPGRLDLRHQHACCA